MRILYHHRTRATDAQGVHIQEIASAFRTLGHDLRFCAMVNPDEAHTQPAKAAGTKGFDLTGWIKSLPLVGELTQLGYNLWAVPQLLKQAREMGADFIYERHALFNFAGGIAAKRLGIPLILEVNSPLALEEAREGGLMARGLARWAETRITNAATHVLVVSGPLGDILVGQGTDRSRLVLMPNGVDPSKFRPMPADPALQARYGIAGKKILGFLGWFRPWHGLDLLIRAFHRAGLHSRDCAILLVGDGPARADLETLTRSLDLEQHVRFTGSVRHEDVPAHLALIDVAMQPAANEYCCPMKILEYFALGKPVVAPDQANIAELVREGEDALLFRAGDEADLAAKLSTLFDDPARLAAMSSAAAAAIEARGYLWSRNAQRVIDLVTAAKRR